jgi:hypothetical protein
MLPHWGGELNRSLSGSARFTSMLTMIGKCSLFALNRLHWPPEETDLFYCLPLKYVKRKINSNSIPTNRRNMKTLLWTLAFICFSPSTHAAGEAKGFLVFEISRYTYTQGTKGASNIDQKFKIPLTEEFISNFKRVPSQNSAGTGLWCSGGGINTIEGSTRFMWWIQKTTDHRWSINMWGEGVETIKGVKVQSRNPKASQDFRIKNWEDLDMQYMLSYVNNADGINVSFKAKYVSAQEMAAEGFIPTAPVQKADRAPLFKGDDLSKFPLEIHCGFQEN